MTRIRFRDRLRARNAAREIWVARKSDPALNDLVIKACDGDEESGRLLLATHPELMGIDPATLFLLIQIAIKLWLWWQSQKNDNPAEAIEDGEPFDAVVDDDEN